MHVPTREEWYINNAVVEGSPAPAQERGGARSVLVDQVVAAEENVVEGP